MEFSQRLECTQELNGTQNERIYPEQIGFLGICGKKYPVNKGPNKIGRDPQTCSIILNLNSVSRQHAVLNVLNKKDFMLMDLDSANKTKLSGKSDKNTCEFEFFIAPSIVDCELRALTKQRWPGHLKAIPPYIPHPIHDGDTVQFGEIFGVFRLIEENDELPMTQALDIPDTPIPIKHISRVNAATTVPESPDVSDRDDSFIVPSQPRGPQSNSTKIQHNVKPGKIISIQPVGTNKMDNIFWGSSKKSTSLNLDDSNTSFNDSIPSATTKGKENVNVNDIHELETQAFLPPEKENDSPDSIYTANTQIPGKTREIEDNVSDSSIHVAKTQLPYAGGSPSVHSLNTQMPCGSSHSIHSLNTQMPGGLGSPSIHNIDTQLPEDLPDVCKIHEQQDMQLRICTRNEEEEKNSEAETLISKKDRSPTNMKSPSAKDSNKLNISDQEMLFDEIDEEPHVDAAESQAILLEDIDLPVNRLVEPELDSQSQIIKPKLSKRNMRIQSGSSTDCEDDFDILLTQKIPEVKKTNDDDLTDCEEDLNKSKSSETVPSKKVDIDLEDMATQVIDFEHPQKEVDFVDMPTQVLETDNIDKDSILRRKSTNVGKISKLIDIDDLPTQIIDEEIQTSTNQSSGNEKSNVAKISKPFDIEDLPTQVIDDDKQMQSGTNEYSEEIVISPFKVPSTSALRGKNKEKSIKVTPSPVSKVSSKEENYYECTQDVLEELIDSPEMIPKTSNAKKSLSKLNVKPFNTSIDSAIQSELESSHSSDKNVMEYVSNLTSEVVREVIIGVDNFAKQKKTPSDGSTSSDLEGTPKKIKPYKVMNTDLPNSQEIKTGMSLSSKSLVTESSSDSDTEKNSEENTPIVYHRRKRKSKPSSLQNVTKQLIVENLPTRVITRPRKLPSRLHGQNTNVGYLVPKYLEDSNIPVDIDKEIITDNISRLKSHIEKSKVDKSCKESKIKQDSIKITESIKKGRKSPKVHELSDKAQPEKSNEETKEISQNENNKNKRDPINTRKEKTKVTSDSDKRKKTSSIEPNKNTNSLGANDLECINLLDTPSPIQTRSRRARVPKNNTPVDETHKANDRSSNINKNHSPERQSRSSRGRRTKKMVNKSPERHEPKKEVRRSKRQKTTKEEPVKVKSILKKSTSMSHEESAVYSNTSGSNTESPRNLKRPLDAEAEPSPKRPRSAVPFNTSLRATPARMNKTQHVLFTAFPVDEVKTKLEKIGAVLVTDVMKCTMLLTLQIKRTFKFLCAVGLGKPIVGRNWVQACVDNNMIVDPWLYLIKDEEAEKRFQFSLQHTLAGKRNFLHGYNVSSTPNVKPCASEMKLIVKCSGGQWKEGGPHWVCVTCSQDKHLWSEMSRRGATLVTTEFILAGVLKQKLDIEGNKVVLK